MPDGTSRVGHFMLNLSHSHPQEIPGIPRLATLEVPSRVRTLGSRRILQTIATPSTCQFIVAVVAPAFCGVLFISLLPPSSVYGFNRATNTSLVFPSGATGLFLAHGFLCSGSRSEKSLPPGASGVAFTSGAFAAKPPFSSNPSRALSPYGGPR